VVCVHINLPLESHVKKELHQNPLDSFKDLSIQKTNSGKRLYRYRVSGSKREGQKKAHFKGLVAYFYINLNLK
jgi:hypothetical protein